MGKMVPKLVKKPSIKERLDRLELCWANLEIEMKNVISPRLNRLDAFTRVVMRELKITPDDLDQEERLMEREAKALQEATDTELDGNDTV